METQYLCCSVWKKKLTCLNLLLKNDCHDIYVYWPTITKDTIRWFYSITIIEHTVNILKPNNGLIPSLLKLFAMFELCLFDYKQYEEGNIMDIISIRCINCNKETVLYLRNTTTEEMITKFVLSAILHHVCMSWILSSIKEWFYEIDKTNHPNWLNKRPCYNTNIW